MAKTHSSQKVYGYSDIQGKAGVYNGKESKASTYITLAAKTSYAVKYNANGGSGAPSADTKWYGETLTLSTTNPTRSGYTFAGWNTKSDGTGSNYASGANYTSNAAATLYAKWTPTSYTISYNANGGSGTMANQTKQHGVEQTLRTNTFTRTGYNFKNYNTKADGSGTSYSSGGTYTANASVTLYAQWTIKTYSIKYNANGGTGAPAAQTKTYNTTLKLSTTKPTRTGYNFLGWNTSSTATTATYAAGANYTANSAATLYAIWQVAAPSLTIIDCYRADSSGVAVDGGNYAKVEAHWSHLVESTLSWACTCNEVSTSTPFDSSTAADNLSGDVSFLLDANMDLDQDYDVTLSLTDGSGTTTKSASIGSVFFTLDFKAGGLGVAFGKASTEDYLADFGMDVNVDGKVTSVSDDNNHAAGIFAKRTNTDDNVFFGIGAGGNRTRGIRDNKLNKWILYLNSADETVYNNTPHKTTGTANLTGGTATGKACWSNGICAGYTLRVFNLSSALASGSSVVIGTLPEGYRPTDYRYQMVYTNNTATSGRVMLQVNTSGEMRLFNYSGSSLGTGVNIYVSDTYTV